jgi:hypothetical protein
MQDKDLSQKLSLLGYTPEWLETGVLSIAQLDEQILFYNTGEDPNLEHYRYKTLHSYIKSRTQFTDKDLNRVLGLAQQEPDKAMAGSIAIFLLKREGLTEAQFNSVCRMLTQFGEWTEKEITKQKALRKDQSS